MNIGMLGYNLKIMYFMSEFSFFIFNKRLTVDPDEMPHYAAFHLGPHFL